MNKSPILTLFYLVFVLYKLLREMSGSLTAKLLYMYVNLLLVNLSVTWCWASSARCNFKGLFAVATVRVIQNKELKDAKMLGKTEGNSRVRRHLFVSLAP